jgi:signal transduction histidine kinase
MSRELNRKQKQIILSEIQRNKVSGLENPYQLRSEIYNKLYAENDHETIIQNIDNFIDDLKYSDDDDFFLGQWQSVKYKNWMQEKIRGEQNEKMS